MIPSEFGLEHHGLAPARPAHWNNCVPQLVEMAVARQEGQLTSTGALAALTGKRTGRSPNDKFIVRDSSTEKTVDWGKVNKPVTPDAFDRLRKKTIEHLNHHELFITDALAGADPDYALPIRVVGTKAWHALFARQLFRRPTRQELPKAKPEYVILSAPDCHADPAIDGTHSEAYIAADFARKIILIAGTHYAGEIKKSIFTVMNYILPDRGVFPMHCSANVGKESDVALFFGLSGTGKTTLSADPRRRLIGDDEHGWSDRGVFNFEGGCYAKCIRLSEEREPQIYNALHFGAVLENVVVDLETRVVDFDSEKFTENTRAAYPVEFIENALLRGHAEHHPKAVIFLTCDAFGVLPPISRLTTAQAMYHFMSGYTAKLAGTEAGVGSEPQATFSTGFGQPFLPRSPMVYAKMLAEKITKHHSTCYLINTGWCGGPYGVGHRIDLAATRAMITAILTGKLTDAPTTQDPIFGLHIPKEVPGVSTELLTPRKTWSDGAAYDAKAKDLANLFVKNFARFPDATAEVKAAGPRT
ncbi:MAG TPA: phosphoenolpyruvate carboxykinase (ATP) [Phycisphaerae bacterium]|nr:phosphoenolpyruvate carboxykinase (ATP) [Phycisphaerae bacterium]